MSFSPAPRHRLDDLFITPFSDTMASLSATRTGAPTSSAWLGTSVCQLMPIYCVEPFTVAKAFVINGATVGTDSWDLGVYRMTDQSTGEMHLVRSTGAVLSAGTVNTAAETGTWKVARANLTASSSSTDANNYDTASVTLKAGRLYLMSVENSKGSATADAVSAIDNGPTFTSRSSVAYNTNLNRVSIWSAVPTTDYTGVLNIKFGGVTQTGAVWSLIEMSGVDTSSSDGIVQQATGTGSSVTPLATLAAFASTANATFGAHGHAAATATTPGTGFTEMSDTTAATPAQALATEWRVDNDTGVDFTITSAAWGACALEIKADTSSFVIPPTRPGTADIYWAMSVSGGTATFFSTTVAGGPASAAGVLRAASLFPLPSRITTAASSTTSSTALVLAGFSSRSLVA